MERMPVSSSSIATIRYDIETQVLEVEYHNGGVYQYQGVPQETFEEFKNSSSKGNFLNQRIRKFYPFNKVG